MHNILCTDMGCHQDYLNNIQTATNKMATYGHLTGDKDAERSVLCSAIMKCADISNCVSDYFFKN